jgi:hypothetical protein
MDFKISHVLRNILPGGIMLGCLYLFLAVNGSHTASQALADNLKESPAFVIFLCTICAFITGSLVDIFSEWFEYLYFKLRANKKRAVRVLLEGNSPRYKLSHHATIFQMLRFMQNFPLQTFDDFRKQTNPLKERAEDVDNETMEYLFQIAKNRAFQIATPYQVERIETYHNMYAYARNLTATLFAAVLLAAGFYLAAACNNTANHSFYLWFIALGLLLFFLMLSRTNDYGYYYARIILGTSFKNRE